jgi:hypothetical protein
MAEEIISNVIPFPKERIRTFGNMSAEELAEEVTNKKREFIEMCAIDIVDELYSKVGFYGFEIDNPRYELDMFMIADCVASLLLKSVDIEHPIQDLAIEIYGPDDEIEEEIENDEEK